MQRRFWKWLSVAIILFAGIISGAIEPQSTTPDKLKVGFFEFNGYHMMDAAGRQSGYGYDILQLLRPYMHSKYEYVGYEKGWSEMLPMLERGEIDLVTSAVKTPEKLKKFDFSDMPIGNSSVIMTVKSGHSKYLPKDYAHWNGIRVGMIPNNSKNDVFHDFARKKGFTYETHFYKHSDELSDALQSGKVDAIVTGSLRRLSKEIIYEQLDIQPFYIIVKKGNKELLDRINAALEAVSLETPGFAGELQHIHYSHWRNHMNTVPFTASELAFIKESNKANRQFVVLLQPGQFPLEYLKDGEPRGIFVDVVKILARSSKLKYKLLVAKDMSEYFRIRAERKCDLIMDIPHDFLVMERTGYVQTKPYYPVGTSMLTRKRSLGDIRTVGTLQDSFIHRIALKNKPKSATIIPFPSNEAAIAAVVAGKIDGAYLLSPMVDNTILNDHTGQLTQERFSRIIDFAVGIRDNVDARFTSIVSKCVNNLSKNELLKISRENNLQFNESMSFRELISENPLTFLFSVFAIIAMLGGALIVVLVFHRRSVKATALLAKNSRMWKSLLDTLPVHVFAKDAQTLRSFFCNKARGEFFGKEPEQLEDVSTREYMPENLAQKQDEATRELVAHPVQVQEQVISLANAKGEMREMHIIQKIFQNADDTPIVLGCAIDQTDLENARRTAQENAELFQKTLISIGDGVITTDAAGSVTMLNPVAERLIGISSEKAAGKEIDEVFHIVNALDASPAVSPLKKALYTGEIVELANHTDLLSFDGRKYHIADCAGPIRDVDGKIIGGVLIFRDVTKEYQNREEIRASLELWDVVGQLAKLHVFKLNVLTRETISDVQYEDSFWPKQDGKLVEPQEWIAPEDLDRFMASHSDFCAGKINSYSISYRTERSGRSRYFNQYSRRSDSDPNIMLGLIQDVTREKEVELERNATLSMWEQIVGAMPILLFVKDADNDFRYTQCNKHFAQFVGKKTEDIVGRTDFELFGTPKYVEQFQKWDHKIMENGRAQEFFEEAPGAEKYYYFQTVKMPHKDSSGRNILIGLSVDITGLRQAEHERNAAMRVWNDVLSAIPIPMYVKDAENDFRYLQCNANFCKLFGKKENEVIGRTDAEILGQLDAADRFKQADIKTMRNDSATEFDETFLAADGKQHSFRALKMPSQNANGKILVGISMDITDLKTALNALDVSGKMWKTIMDELPILFFVKDIDDHFRYIMCNKANAAFLGIPQEMVVGKTTEDISIMNPMVKSYLEDEKQQVKDDNVNSTRITIPDAGGKIIEMEKISVPVVGINGKRLLASVAFDITEREQNLHIAEISSKLLRSIASEHDSSRMLEIIGQITIKVLHCGQIIFVRTPEPNQFLVRMATSVDSPEFQIKEKDILDCKKYLSPFRERINRGEEIFIGRMGDEPAFESLYEEHPAYREAALALSPYIQNGKVLGVVLYVYRGTHIFTEIDKRIFQLVNMGIEIVTARREQDQILSLQRQSLQLELKRRITLAECFNVFMDSDYMDIPFDKILEEIRKYLGASSCALQQIRPDTSRMCCLANAIIPGGKNIFTPENEDCFDTSKQWYSDLKQQQLITWNCLASEDPKMHFSCQWEKTVSEQKISAMWLAAVSFRGETIGCLNIIYDTHSPREFSPDDESFVHSAAQMVSLMMMRMQSRDQIVRALEQAQSAEKAKSYFLASMSHEIRTPLNAVIGFTELMKGASLDYETQQEYLENIFNSGNLLLQLINDILDLSKLEADQMSIIPESVDLFTFCNEVCRSFQHIANQKMLNLLVRIPRDVPNLMLDPLRMRQILFNLVGNAVKFTQTGSVRVSATFTPVSTTEGSLMIQVTDTGIGIAKDDRQKLFEPFVQLSKMRGTNAANSGTGLGLVIVRKLVDKMGGTLTLESEEGKGSTFSILLPQVDIVDGKTQHEQLIVSRTVNLPKKTFGEQLPAGDSSQAKKLRVLVVDDVPLNTKILASLLGRIHVDCETVCSGQAALEKLKEKQFDWILTDLMMPGMNGDELVKAIRRNPEFDSIRIGLVTAEQDAMAIDKSLFSIILTKPIGTHRLQDALFRSENI